MEGQRFLSLYEANIDDYGTDELVYPIALDQGRDIFKSPFLLSMNLAVMKLTAAEGFTGLAKLLGMPTVFSMPSSWKSGKAGLVHRPDKPSSIAEFAILHEVMRKQGVGGNYCTPGSTTSTVNVNDITGGGDEMARSEDCLGLLRSSADICRSSSSFRWKRWQPSNLDN